MKKIEKKIKAEMAKENPQPHSFEQFEKKVKWSAVSSMASFVTTTKGVEGIDLRHNEECLIADSATDFAAAVIRLEADKKLQVRLATQALKRLRELYNPQEMLERRLAVYDEILQNNTN